MGIRKKKIEIGPDTVLQRRNDLLFNEIDGEVVMLSVENNEYYGMDKVGSRIWELLNNPISLKEVVTKLLSEFDVQNEQCLKDTVFFLKLLYDKALITCK